MRIKEYTMKILQCKIALLQITLFISSLILFDVVYANQTDYTELYLPKDKWPAKEISREELFQHIDLALLPVLGFDGTILNSNDQKLLRETLYTPLIQERGKDTYFLFSWKESIPKDEKHILVTSDKALAIRGFILARDYEVNSIDKDEALIQKILQKTSEKTSKMFDTIHVLSVPEKWLKEAIIKESDLATWESFTKIIKNRDYYNYEKYAKWHDKTLKIFKELTNTDTHKLLKGPFDSQKKGKDREEEWGAIADAGIQGVVYQDPAAAFYDLTRPTFVDNDRLYILLYAGDGTTKRQFGLEFDDIMGIIIIPKELLNDIGSKFMYYQIDPTNADKSKSIDFVVFFEVVSNG